MNKTTENPVNTVRWVDIDEHQEDQRIDNFLLTFLKGVPKSRIYRILRKGEVRVNKGRVRPEYRLKRGDRLRIPPVRVPEKRQDGPSESDQNLAWLESRIIHEDKAILVLNKPCGLAVHGGSGLSYGVIEALRVLRRDEPYLELVHRLDRETSGCLILAKRRSHLRRLHEQLRNGEVHKHYRALLKGVWQGGQRRIDASLEKNTLQSGERMVRVTEEGKESASIFTPITQYSVACYMDVELLTGRTHQIRVHAAHAGHPLAGDRKYGEKDFNQQMKKLGLKRQFLHAWSITLRHPQTDKKVTYAAPLDEDLENVLQQLKPVN